MINMRFSARARVHAEGYMMPGVEYAAFLRPTLSTASFSSVWTPAPPLSWCGPACHRRCSEWCTLMGFVALLWGSVSWRLGPARREGNIFTVWHVVCVCVYFLWFRYFVPLHVVCFGSRTVGVDLSSSNNKKKTVPAVPEDTDPESSLRFSRAQEPPSLSRDSLGSCDKTLQCCYK